MLQPLLQVRPLYLISLLPHLPLLLQSRPDSKSGEKRGVPKGLSFPMLK